MKKLFFTIALGVLASAAFAQEFKTDYDDSQGTFERVTQRGPYLTGKFFDNWFIGVGGGVNLYMSNGDVRADFGDRLAPALDAYIGKWFTPSVGFRVMYGGLSAKGASREATEFAPARKIQNAGQSDQYYEKEFNFWSVQGHFLWNLSNAIGGYRQDRTWSFVPYIGAGYMQAEKHGSKTRGAVGNAGLLHKVRISNVVDIMIDMRYTVLKPEMDAWRGSADVDNMVSLTAGLSFNLGPKGGFKRPVQPIPADYTPYERRISQLESDLNSANSKANRLQRELEECLNRPQPKPPVEVEVVAPAAMHVYFKIGSARIAETDMQNIESIARTIKSTPGMVYSVIGSADSKTGSAARNRQLSNQRAKAVADALTNRFGVSASQLDVDALGGIDSGGNPELDRAVIVEMKK